MKRGRPAKYVSVAEKKKAYRRRKALAKLANDTATTEIGKRRVGKSVDLGGRRIIRSEERRVGKEGRSRWSPYHLKKKKINKMDFREGTHSVVNQYHQEIFTGMYISRFFFFQAEDGIRDESVTGVQTCALPI